MPKKGAILARSQYMKKYSLVIITILLNRSLIINAENLLE